MDNKELFYQELQSILDEYERLQAKPKITPSNQEPPDFEQHPYLRWTPRIYPKSKTVYKTVEQVRCELPTRLEEYLQADYDTPSLLLVQVEAGTGKSYSGVQKFQEWASQGVKCLWLGQRHDMFHSLSIHPNFDVSLWQHWQGISEDTCDYNHAMQQWMQKGYPSIKLCIPLCHASGHMANGCFFRAQAKSQKPICFGMFQHAIVGLPRDGFQVAIIDENPLGVFVGERTIPPNGIQSEGHGIASVKRLYAKLYDLTQRGKSYSGMELMLAIGGILIAVFKDIKEVATMKVMLPEIFLASDVDNAPYWFLKDLLIPLAREYKCYNDGLEKWAEWVTVDATGIHILQGKQEWGGLPDKLIIFDATAEPNLYHEIFPNRLIEVYNPSIRRLGTINVIVSKLNGKGTLKNKEGELSRNIKSILEQCQEQIFEGKHKRPGFVCQKEARDLFAEVFGEANVLHFYNQRGTNALEKSDIGFVIGTPAPDPLTIFKITLALSRDRMEAFDPLLGFNHEERFYNLTPEGATLLGHMGEVPSRLLGDYKDPVFRAVYHQHRESEIFQAIHRFRLVTNAIPVWVHSPAISSLVEIDAIYNIVPLAPDGIGLDNWIKLKRWLPVEAKEGRAVGRKEIADFLKVKENTIAARNWLGIIQSRFLDDRGLPMWAFEDDPQYAGKRGRRIQRLKPVEY